MSNLLQKLRTRRQNRYRAQLPWRSLPTLIAALAVILALWKLPAYQVTHTPGTTAQNRFDREDAARKTLAQIIGGIVILGGLYMSFKTFGLSREGHITDRFTKAIEQLGKTDGTTPNIEVRLGAIYALERIALDSPRDHWTIMEVLTAYVRQNAPLDADRPYTEGEKPRTDIQAILTVIGRRKTGTTRERPEHRLDLSSTRLCGMSLVKANLQDADFARANLQAASLWQANLQEAYLRSANLQAASLWQANLQEASLGETNLKEAKFWGANLQQASLEKADLQQAHLWEANMEEAYLAKANLQEASLESANLLGANLSGANLQYVLSATPTQIQAAKNWQTAQYSSRFRAELGLPPEPPAA